MFMTLLMTWDPFFGFPPIQALLEAITNEDVDRLPALNFKRCISSLLLAVVVFLLTGGAVCVVSSVMTRWLAKVHRRRRFQRSGSGSLMITHRESAMELLPTASKTYPYSTPLSINSTPYSEIPKRSFPSTSPGSTAVASEHVSRKSSVANPFFPLPEVRTTSPSTSTEMDAGGSFSSRMTSVQFPVDSQQKPGGGNLTNSAILDVNNSLLFSSGSEVSRKDDFITETLVDEPSYSSFIPSSPSSTSRSPILEAFSHSPDHNRDVPTKSPLTEEDSNLHQNISPLNSASELRSGSNVTHRLDESMDLPLSELFVPEHSSDPFLQSSMDGASLERRSSRSTPSEPEKVDLLSEVIIADCRIEFFVNGELSSSLDNNLQELSVETRDADHTHDVDVFVDRDLEHQIFGIHRTSSDYSLSPWSRSGDKESPEGEILISNESSSEECNLSFASPTVERLTTERPAWSERASSAPPLGISTSQTAYEKAYSRLNKEDDWLSSPASRVPGSFPSPNHSPLLTMVPTPPSRSQSGVRSSIDVALAMQLRPGFGVGSDAAWMVRFLMSAFGWLAILVARSGEFDDL